MKKLHITGLVRYLLLLLTDILALWFFHGYLFLLLLYMLILILPCSAILTYQGLKRLSVSLSAKSARLPYQTENQIYIHLSNHTFFPLFHLRMEISEENLFLKETRTFTRQHYRLSGSTRRRKRIKKTCETLNCRRRSLLLFPKENLTVPHTVRKDNCGNIRCILKHITLTDYLGIVTFGIAADYTTSVVYLPKKAPDTGYDTMFARLEALQKEIEKKGYDDPEPLQIREYIPGDKLNHIHWKLSSKCEQLMVKEFQTEEGGSIFLACELYYSPEDNSSSINTELDRVYQAALHFLQLRYRVVIGWWSVSTHTFCHREVLDEDMLEQVFLEIVQEQTYTDRQLLEHYLGDDSPYLIKW